MLFLLHDLFPKDPPFWFVAIFLLAMLLPVLAFVVGLFAFVAAITGMLVVVDGGRGWLGRTLGGARRPSNGKVLVAFVVCCVAALLSTVEALEIPVHVALAPAAAIGVPVGADSTIKARVFAGPFAAMSWMLVMTGLPVLLPPLRRYPPFRWPFASSNAPR